MPNLLITLTTDFGEAAPYVAAMKGVILAANADARIVDLTHFIPPQDVRHAAFFLKHSVSYFPSETLHVVVVDPGVGSDRALLYVECDRQRLLVPDNGCWTLLPQPSIVRRLEDSRYWGPLVMPTFHGRDILAPVAGQLSRGLNPALLGPTTTDWVKLDLPSPVRESNCLKGEVIFIDRFGNLITSIPAEWIAAAGDNAARVLVGEELVNRFVTTYAESEVGERVALISSFGLLEVAVVRGNAAKSLNAKIGTAVIVEIV